MRREQRLSTRESYSNDKSAKKSKNEIFSQLEIPPETPFIVRLDGWRFQALSEDIGAEKPFDEKFAKCIAASGTAFFKSDLNSVLVYAASDELNVLFPKWASPFRRRVEKMDSVSAGIASSAFSLNIKKSFGKSVTVAFDSRIVVLPSEEKIVDYLVLRQRNAWRNHNNAYAYWLFRKIGYKPLEAAKTLESLKTKDIHETLFKHGINLAQTPAWQRRGILIYKEPYEKKVRNRTVTRWQVKQNWNLPVFSSEEGRTLIQQILKWSDEKRKKTIA